MSIRLLRPLSKARNSSREHALRYASSTSNLARKQAEQSQDGRTTHFGFQQVPESAKQSRGFTLPTPQAVFERTAANHSVVGAVFSSVASSYDKMNDLMSLGIHRLWKDHFVRSLNPGLQSILPSQSKAWTILDIAGGTGDIAFRMLDHAATVNNDRQSHVIVSDINPDMLAEGRNRSLEIQLSYSERLSFLEANAENLSMIDDNSIDLYTVAFGIRNFTNKQIALDEAFRVLKPGGVFACLEFSHVSNTVFNSIYKRWSFGAIPLLGQLVAGDRESYQYLVESIEQFPSQSEFADMIRNSGFLLPGRGWEDLTGGIAAIHKGVKPLV